MIRYTLFFIASTVIITFGQDTLSNNPDFPILTGEYLGQVQPGITPKLFAPFLTSNVEYINGPLTVSPDGKEIYYSVSNPLQASNKIMFTKLIDGKWTAPKTASFSGKHHDDGPLFSLDGNRIYFNSTLPLTIHSKEETNTNIWYFEREKFGWVNPQTIGKHIQSSNSEKIQKITENGAIYFTREDSDKNITLYRSSIFNSVYNEPQLIKNLSNPEAFFEPAFSYDEDFYIFTLIDYKKENSNSPQLYICFKDKNDNWTIPKSMGDMINQGGAKFPRLSTDGKYIFFLSNRTGTAQYFWVDAEIVEICRNGSLDIIDQLYSSMLETNIDSTKKNYFSYKNTYSEYYNFDESLLNEVAGRLMLEGYDDRAIEIYNFNFELYPATKFYSQKLVIALLEEDEELFENLLKKIKSEPDNSKLLEEKLNRLGEKLLSMNEVSLALKTFIVATDINPNSSWPYFRLANAYQKLNYKEAAIQNYRKAVEIDPNNKYAAERLKSLSTK